MENINDEKLLLLIGEKIKELRVKAGYSNQEKFSREADLPRAQYGRYENGQNMTILSLFKILKFHEISFEDFFKSLKM